MSHLARTAAHRRRLLVFDNAESVEDVQPFFPAGAHVLVTARTPAWPQLGTAVPFAVPVLERAETVTLLHSRVSGLDDPTAARLADLVGDYPLAVAQVAAYLDDNPVSPTAYLDPDAIPTTLFTRHPEHLDPPLAAATRDPHAWAALLGHVRQSALATVHDDTLTVHRLIQAVLRDQLPPADRDSRRATVHQLLAAADPATPPPQTPGRTGEPSSPTSLPPTSPRRPFPQSVPSRWTRSATSNNQATRRTHTSSPTPRSPLGQPNSAATPRTP